MYTLIIVLLIIVAVLMCGIVLVQESKGGGLASGFSSSNQIMGVRKTTDFLEKTTWTLAIVMVVLCVVSSAFAGSKGDDNAIIAAPPAPTAPTAPSLPNRATTSNGIRKSLIPRPHATSQASTATASNCSSAPKVKPISTPYPTTANSRARSSR